MPKTIITWEWEEAFSKFGFGDGDMWNGTHEVEGEIESLGYDVECDTWGIHNYMIVDIKKDGKSILFPEDHPTGDNLDEWLPEVVKRMKRRGNMPDDYEPEPIGYEEPRLYLPYDILEHLDKTFTDDYECDYGH